MRLVPLMMHYRLHLGLWITAIQWLRVQMVEHVLPFGISASVVVALEVLVVYLLQFKVLGCILRELSPVRRHAAFLAIRNYALWQTRRILCQSDWLLLSSGGASFGEGYAGLAQGTLTCLETLLVGGIQILSLIDVLSSHHRHVYVICLAQVSVVLGLRACHLAVAVALIKLAVHVSHDISCHSEAVVVVVWVENACLVSGVAHLVIDLLALLRADIATLIYRSLTDLFLAIHYFPIRAEALLEITVRAMVALTLVDNLGLVIADTLTSLVHAIVVMRLKSVRILSLVWLHKYSHFITLTVSLQGVLLRTDDVVAVRVALAWVGHALVRIILAGPRVLFADKLTRMLEVNFALGNLVWINPIFGF